jgi:hypothetical protein
MFHVEHISNPHTRNSDRFPPNKRTLCVASQPAYRERQGMFHVEHSCALHRERSPRGTLVSCSRSAMLRGFSSVPFKLLSAPPLRRRNHLGNRLRQNMNWTEANGVVFHAEHIWHFLREIFPGSRGWVVPRWNFNLNPVKHSVPCGTQRQLVDRMRIFLSSETSLCSTWNIRESSRCSC